MKWGLLGGFGLLAVVCAGIILASFVFRDKLGISWLSPETDSTDVTDLPFLEEPDSVPWPVVEPLDPFAGPLPTPPVPALPPVARDIPELGVTVGGTESMQPLVDSLTMTANDTAGYPDYAQAENSGDYLLAGQVYDLGGTPPTEGDSYLGGELYVSLPLSEVQLQGATTTNVGVLYFSPLGAEFFPGYLDAATGRVIFITSHLSSYAPAVGTPSAEIKRFIQEEATSLAVAAESKMEEVAFNAFTEYLDGIKGLDPGTKAIIQASAMKSRDNIAAILTSSGGGDMQSALTSLNLAFGKAIADNVAPSALQGILKEVSGNPDIVVALGEATGAAAGGDYWKMVEVLGKAYSDQLIVVKGAKLAIKVVGVTIEVWKEHEWQSAYKAYTQGAPRDYIGIRKSVQAGDWEQLTRSYGGIVDHVRKKYPNTDGSQMSFDEAKTFAKKLFDERKQREVREAQEAKKLEDIYRDFKKYSFTATNLANRLGLINPETNRLDVLVEPQVFRSYVAIYRSIQRDMTTLGLNKKWWFGDTFEPPTEARELFDAFLSGGAAAYRQKLDELRSRDADADEDGAGDSRDKGSDTPPGTAPLPVCDLGEVVIGQATVAKPAPAMSLGPLFSDGGSFEEKGVDKPCDPGKELGPFPVSAGGKLVVRLKGSPPAPNVWSLGNSGTGLTIWYEPQIGEVYGPGQKILDLAIPAEKTETKGEAEWPGPGRLRAYTIAPRGSGPMSGSCFEQSYTAEAEIVEVSASAPAQPGMKLQDGDRIMTDGSGSATVEFPSGAGAMLIGPDTDVTFDLFAIPLDSLPAAVPVAGEPVKVGDPEWETNLFGIVLDMVSAGLPMPDEYWNDPATFWMRSTTLRDAYDRIKGIQDPCEAAVTFKLFMDAKQGQYTWDNAPTRVGVLLADMALIYFPPNKWRALEAVVKLALAPVPILGQIANVKTGIDLYDRIMKEVMDDASSKKAKRTLAAFDTSSTWTLEEIKARQNKLENTIAAKQKEIEQARTDLDNQVDELKLELKNIEGRGFNCYDVPDALARESWEKKCSYHRYNYNVAVNKMEYARDSKVKELMAQILEAQTEKSALEDYREPVKTGDCESIKPPKSVIPREKDPCYGWKLAKVTMNKGFGWFVKAKVGPVGEELWTIAVYLDLVPKAAKELWELIPNGTEFSVEKGDETATVRVFDGEVKITSPDGQQLTVTAGQQVTLPDGTISDFDLASDDGGLVAGIPLRDLPLDDDIPEPYDTYVPDFKDDSVPPDWLWQETDVYHSGPGDAVLESPEPGVLRVTVPNENEFWAYRDDAPRLLHKATGDFDLEAEMLLECEGLDHAISEFIIFAPGSSLGYLKKQMDAGGLSSQYLIAGGGWLRMQNMNKLTAANRPFADGPDAPDTPVRFKMSRRGDVLKTYWSTDGGETWTLSGRQVLPLPETLWAGWLFKRMAHDGLHDKPAITTFRDVRLTTAPLGTMLDDDWDVIGFTGTVIPLGTELVMAKDGSQPGNVQAYSPWSIPGDFDLTVRFDAPPLEDWQPGQERYIHVGVCSYDEKNHAYVRNAQHPDWPHRYDSDMRINESYGRYHWEDTQDSSGRVRLVRQGGVFSSYFWKDGDWVLLVDWNEGFSDPVFLDFRFNWKTPSPYLQTVRFTIERLDTPDGVWIGPAEEVQLDAVESPGTAAVPTTGPTSQTTTPPKKNFSPLSTLTPEPELPSVPTSPPVATPAPTLTLAPVPATPTPQVPTSTPTLSAPPAVELLEPSDGSQLQGVITFRWTWAVNLDQGEVFDVRVCKGEGCQPQFGKTNTRDTTWVWALDEGGGTYRWQVVVIRWEGDRVAAESGHSPVWGFDWSGGHPPGPQPTPTPPF